MWVNFQLLHPTLNIVAKMLAETPLSRLAAGFFCKEVEVNIFFLLIFAHTLADTSLQTSSMARGKNRHRASDLHAWPFWLAAHSIIHGGLVYLVTGSLEYGIIEIVLHVLIDFFKCEKRYGCTIDQALHGICKLIYSGGI